MTVEFSIIFKEVGQTEKRILDQEKCRADRASSYHHCQAAWSVYYQKTGPGAQASVGTVDCTGKWVWDVWEYRPLKDYFTGAK